MYNNDYVIMFSLDGETYRSRADDIDTIGDLFDFSGSMLNCLLRDLPLSIVSF